MCPFLFLSQQFAATDMAEAFVRLRSSWSDHGSARPEEACRTREESNMIEILSGFPTTVLAFSCKGQVTTRDYETVLIPTVEDALKHHRKVRLFYQIDSSFTGIEPGAIWHDFKIGMGHLLRWERIAVVTDVKWISYVFRAFSFLIPCQVKLFRVNETTQAQAWIVEDMTP